MDKLPPYAEDEEKSIIGSCLMDPVVRLPEAARSIVNPDFFYDMRCRTAWEVMNTLEPSQVNIVTVAGELKGKFENAIQFLAECQDIVPSAANLPTWIESAQSAYTLRKIIATCTKAVGDAYQAKNAGPVLDAIERDILKIRPQHLEEKDFRSLILEATDLIEYRAKNWDKITGYPTGLADLDRLTDGIHAGEMVVIAAQPSCGKTALGVNIAMHNALNGVPIGILSAEMRPVQLTVRSICAESHVNFRRITEPDCVKIALSLGKLAKAPVYIESVSGCTIGQIQAITRRMSQRYGVKLIVVDYIQLIAGTGDNREQQIASVGRGLKSIATELSIPVLALSQLNDDGRLRESRSIGMDADSVWILANDGEWQPQIQPVTLTVTKCRDGETGKVLLTFLKSYTRFESSSKGINDDDIPKHYSD